MDNKELSETVSGILLIYLLVTNTFSLLISLSNALLLGATLGAVILYRYLYWILLAALIIAALILYRKKRGLPVGLKLLDNDTTCKTAGLLIAADGAIDLSLSLPGQIYSILTTYQVFRDDLRYNGLLPQEKHYVAVSVIIDLISVCQILLGLFIAKRRGKKAVDPAPDAPNITG